MKKLLSLLALLAGAAHAATLTPIQLISPAGSTSGQVIASTGTSTAPAWGNVSASTLAAQAANTVLANVTASSASPNAFAMPSCSTSTSALQYTSGTGFTCYASSATTTGTLAQFAATTSAQLAGVLSDETGSGAAVFATGSVINPTSTGATTPGTGKFTTLQTTGAITPAYPAGIVGNVTGSAVTAGSVGETISSVVASGSAVSLTSGTAANVTSISLTAGDWDVWGVVSFVPSAAPVNLGAWVGTTSATIPTPSSLNTSTNFLALAFGSGQGQTFPTGTARINVSTTTTVYLGAYGGFGSGTLTAYGYIQARRR